MRVRLHCGKCHADDAYTCERESASRGYGHDIGDECFCPCHEFPECAACGAPAEWQDCWQCDEDGFVDHDCGEDCCACLHPEPNVRCDICNGNCGWWYCTAKCSREPTEQSGGSET